MATDEGADAAAGGTKKEPPYSHVKPCAFGSAQIDSYIGDRFNPMIEWYDKKAGGAKSRYLRNRAWTVVGGALVPVLVNLNVEGLPFAEHAGVVVRVATTVISILVVILVSLEGVLHYREQWVNYRSTEQFMRKEYHLFSAGQGIYAGLGADDHAHAMQTFIDRIEEALSSESSSTLQILTSNSDAAGKEREYKPPVARSDDGADDKDGAAGQGG